MRLAQLLGAKLERGSGHGREMRRRERKVLSSRAKRPHMALTCQEGVVGVFLGADNFQNRLAQQIDSAAGFRRQPDLGDTIDGAAARLRSREVDLVAHDHPRQGRTKPGDDRGVSGMLGGARVGDNQSQIGALDFRPRSRDADLLDGAPSVPSVELVRPFENLPDLPDDLAEAFDSMKLAILHHKRDAWQAISTADVLRTLDALKALVTAPSDDAPF